MDAGFRPACLDPKKFGQPITTLLVPAVFTQVFIPHYTPHCKPPFSHSTQNANKYRWDIENAAVSR